MRRLLQVSPPGAEANNTRAIAVLQALRKDRICHNPTVFHLHFVMCLTIACPICNGPAVLVDTPGAAHELIYSNAGPGDDGIPKAMSASDNHHALRTRFVIALMGPLHLRHAYENQNQKFIPHHRKEGNHCSQDSMHKMSTTMADFAKPVQDACEVRVCRQSVQHVDFRISKP